MKYRAPTTNDIFKTLALCSTAQDKARALASLMPSRKVVFKVIDALHENGQDASVLENYAKGLGWDLDRRTGARPVEKGASRIYAVQESQNATFIRIPTHTLGLKKGDHADVTFEDDQVVVRPRKRRNNVATRTS